MINIRLVTSIGCSECESAKQILQEAKTLFPAIKIEEIDVMSRRGIELTTKFGFMANPGMIINGEFFSSGALNKNQFFKKMQQLSA